MLLIYSTEISLYFNIIPKHTDAFVPSWHKFKNSVLVEIGLLHSQPFTKGHFHFFITVENDDLQMLLLRPNQMEVERGTVRTIGL
jgi:hypothetical protein